MIQAHCSFVGVGVKKPYSYGVIDATLPPIISTKDIKAYPEKKAEPIDPAELERIQREQEEYKKALDEFNLGRTVEQSNCLPE